MQTQITDRVNLSGEWIGHYPGHLEQVVKITQTGEELVAVKITGDEHIPGGAVSFRANIRTGIGECQIAEKEYRNAEFVPGRLKILNSEKITFTISETASQVGNAVIELRKDD